ncbi:hypothetical protein [Staphylococcus chromogenes]|uniref:hypothetical protein n=1 Tax=Staphylococcus chromogenes TaxID=46126 RepID=UPI003D7B793D
MEFNREEVRQYVALVRDENPLHPEIVPGQLVVERLWSTLKRGPSHYQVKYKKPVYVDTQYTIEQNDQYIALKSVTGDTMLEIELKRSET